MFLIGGAIERANSIAKSHSVALSRLRLQLETLDYSWRIILKKHQTRKIVAQSSSLVAASLSFRHETMAFGPNSNFTSVWRQVASGGLQWKTVASGGGEQFRRHQTFFFLETCLPPLWCQRSWRRAMLVEQIMRLTSVNLKELFDDFTKEESNSTANSSGRKFID